VHERDAPADEVCPQRDVIERLEAGEDLLRCPVTPPRRGQVFAGDQSDDVRQLLVLLEQQSYAGKLSAYELADS
jgi:hypothetical protein